MSLFNPVVKFIYSSRIFPFPLIELRANEFFGNVLFVNIHGFIINKCFKLKIDFSVKYLDNVVISFPATLATLASPASPDSSSTLTSLGYSSTPASLTSLGYSSSPASLTSLGYSSSSNSVGASDSAYVSFSDG